jgi:hypothetical protein
MTIACSELSNIESNYLLLRALVIFCTKVYFDIFSDNAKIKRTAKMLYLIYIKSVKGSDAIVLD